MAFEPMKIDLDLFSTSKKLSELCYVKDIHVFAVKWLEMVLSWPFLIMFFMHQTLLDNHFEYLSFEKELKSKHHSLRPS